MAVRPIFPLLWLGHPLFVFRLASYAFLEFGSFGWIKKKEREKITRSQRTGGLKPQHHCGGAWKQQDMHTKSTQTQYGGKFDGRCRNKEQTGYANKTPIYGSRGGTIQKYFATPKKYFKSQCFSQITVEKFDKSKKLLQILRKFVDPQITFSIIRKYFANP